MKISGTTKAGGPRGAQKAAAPAKGGKAFSPTASGAKVSSTNTVSAKAPVETLNALIDLQSDGASRGKMLSAGRRALQLLDRVQQGLLAGRIHVSDMEALAESADQSLAGLKAETNPQDAEVAALYNDISLRARVELAKLGR